MPPLQMEQPTAKPGSSDAGSNWQDVAGQDGWRRLATALLLPVAIVCVHGLLYSLHTILVPFALAGFIVLAMQPQVEFCYAHLVGLRGCNRWCVCCCKRRGQVPLNSDPENATQPLLGNADPKAGLERSGTHDVFAAPERVSLRRAGTKKRLTLTDPFKEDEDEEGMAIYAAESCCRFVVVFLALAFLLLLAVLVLLPIGYGALQMRNNAASYQEGYERLERNQEKATDAFTKELKLSPEFDVRLKDAEKTITLKMEEWVWSAVNTVIMNMTEGLASGVLLTLYVMFWLMTPLPTGGKAGYLVRSYIYKKTLVSFLFGTSVTLMFLCLGVTELAFLFGVITFFFNYIPEVGFIISIALPAPVILLDGRIEHPFEIFMLATIGQLILKMLFSNILEVKLIEADSEMNIHPVWVLLGLSYFGYIWGPIGMLISVPLIAMIKTASTSLRDAEDHSPDDLLPELAGSLTACLEGRPANSLPDNLAPASNEAVLDLKKLQR